MTDSEKTFEYDVFLSHSSLDKAVVRALAERLRSDGLAVWLDEWEIQLGDSIPLKLEEGLDRSRILLVCLSANASQSDWVRFEGYSKLFQDPSNQTRKFIPVRLDDAPIRIVWQQFAYVDWQQQDEQEYQRLLKACKIQTVQVSSGPNNDQKPPSQERETSNSPISIAQPIVTKEIEKTKESWLAGHTSYVRSVTLSADGTKALSGSDDKTVKLWDLETGRCIKTLAGHTYSVRSISLSADGTKALSSDDKTVKLWNLETGRCIKTLEGHTHPVMSVNLFADGTKALSSGDNKIKLWDLKTGRCIKLLEGHTRNVWSVSLSTNEKQALSGSYDNTVKLWDLETGRCIKLLEGHTHPVGSVSLSTDGTQALSGSGDKTIKLWDLETGRCIKTLEGHTHSVRSISLSADGTKALSGSDDKTIKLWDLETGRCIKTLEGHTHSVRSISLSADGTKALSSDDNTVKLWDLKTGHYLKTLEGHTHPIRSVSLSTDGTQALSGSDDSTVKLWDLKTERCIKTLEGHTHSVRSVSLSADGTQALSGSDDNTIKLWDLETERCIKTLKGHTHSVRSVSLFADGTQALSGSDDNTVKLWDLETGRCIKTLKGHTYSVMSVSLSADGTQALSGSNDKTIKLWDLETGHCIKILKGHTHLVRSVSLSADGTQALSGSDDNTVKLWDLETGRCIKTLEGHTHSVRSVSLSTDGTQAVSGSYDNTVKLWDLETGCCIKTLKKHTSRVLSVALHQNQLFSSSSNGQVIVWQFPPPILLSNLERASSSSYTNAKVLLVGDSGVGKTGLAIRLTQNYYEPTDSTDAHWATQLKLEHETSPDGGDREIWLWDFAGQADYRLIHQLFMDETSLAILVFNPQDDDPFDGLSKWNRDITRAAQRPFGKLLVGGRCDRGGLMVSQSRIKQFQDRCQYIQYFQTSARENQGCDALKDAIIKAIDWDAIPYTSSPRIFKLLKDEILKLRDQGLILLRISELKQQLQFRLPEDSFSLDQLLTVVSLLAGPGIVWKLEFGDFILLQPEWINKYAAAVVRSVREHIGEIGIISESQVLSGDLNYVLKDHAKETEDHEKPLTKREMERLDRPQEEIVLRAMHQTLVDRGICARIHTPEGTELIFPAYFKRELPENPGHPPILVSYKFQGFLEDIYATLVVQLYNTKAFENGDLWRYAADFHSPAGLRMGLKMVAQKDGTAEICVYFDPTISDDLKVMFTKYIHEHLLETAKDVQRLRHFCCSHCQYPVSDNELARRRLLKQGEMAQLRCQDCDEKFDLWDLLEQKFASPEAKQDVQEIESEAKTAIENESTELILVGHAFSIAGEAGQLFRQISNHQGGIDGEIEFKDLKGQPAAKRILLLLKSSEFYAHTHRNQKDIFAIADQTLLNYWKKQTCPIMLVFRDDKGKISWMDINEYLNSPYREDYGDRRAQNEIIFDGEPFTALNLLKMRDRLLSLRS